MIALDTNILARYYVAPANEQERKEQELAATALSSERSFFVSADVALELAWVLIGPYDCDAQQVRRVITHLAALPNVTLEQTDEFAGQRTGTSRVWTSPMPCTWRARRNAPSW